jgi:hypothetical protein|tara:strand:+ start:2478 stop:2588 length:111 start_codon:yes stop_codon:yes gene_type:complete
MGLFFMAEKEDSDWAFFLRLLFIRNLGEGKNREESG